MILNWILGQTGGAASRSWCVVQTHPHAETMAICASLRQGYSVYLPRYLKRRSRLQVEIVPERVAILLDLLGRKVRVVRDGDAIAAS